MISCPWILSFSEAFTVSLSRSSWAEGTMMKM